MNRFRLTPAAQRDLSSIWDYTEQRWGGVRAESYLFEIKEAIERIAHDPERGMPADDVRPDYRRYSVGSHLVFSTEAPHGVSVIRILHQRMDPGRHL